MSLTKEQFEQGYAARSGVSVEWLRQHGREALPCDCKDAMCEGWQMAHVHEDEWFAGQTERMS